MRIDAIASAYRQAAVSVAVVQTNAARLFVALLLAFPVYSHAQTASQTVSPSGFIWTGGTCCGQSQPQFIHAPDVITQYYITGTHYPATNGCNWTPTQSGQTCCVYAWGVCVDYRATGTCPDNSTGTPADNPVSCTCNKGYIADSTATKCVSQCLIPDLTPLTDPIAIDFDNGHRWHPEGLTPDFQTKLRCVENGITAAGGTYVGTSAYRPTSYQRHLYEIVQKDGQLSPAYMSAHPECQDLRDKINVEMGPAPNGHALHSGQAVALPGHSRHESGTAFDLTPSGLTNAQLAPIYSSCGVSHTAVRSEPWHTQ